MLQYPSRFSAFLLALAAICAALGVVHAAGRGELLLAGIVPDLYSLSVPADSLAFSYQDIALGRIVELNNSPTAVRLTISSRNGGVMREGQAVIPYSLFDNERPIDLSAGVAQLSQGLRESGSHAHDLHLRLGAPSSVITAKPPSDQLTFSVAAE